MLNKELSKLGSALAAMTLGLLLVTACTHGDHNKSESPRVPASESEIPSSEWPRENQTFADLLKEENTGNFNATPEALQELHFNHSQLEKIELAIADVEKLAKPYGAESAQILKGHGKTLYDQIKELERKFNLHGPVYLTQSHFEQMIKVASPLCLDSKMKVTEKGFEFTDEKGGKGFVAINWSEILDLHNEGRHVYRSDISGFGIPVFTSYEKDVNPARPIVVEGKFDQSTQFYGEWKTKYWKGEYRFSFDRYTGESRVIEVYATQVDRPTLFWRKIGYTYTTEESHHILCITREMRMQNKDR